MNIQVIPDDPRHGTTNGYGNHHCRCDLCKAAQSDYMRSRYQTLQFDTCACGQPKRKCAETCRACYLEAVEESAHGTEGRYAGHGCRCEECRLAANAARNQRWWANPEARERANAKRRERHRRDKVTG